MSESQPTPQPHPGQVFADADRKRWRRLRRLFNTLGLSIAAILVVFLATVWQSETLPKIILPSLRRPYQSLREPPRRRPLPPEVRRRKLRAKNAPAAEAAPDDLRAAYYVIWDAGSFASLRQHYRQIDLLFPEWLHALTPDGSLQALSADNQLFFPAAGAQVQPVESTVLPFLKKMKAETQVLPLVNNYDPASKTWLESVGVFLSNAAARERFMREALRIVQAGPYQGLSLDFEAIPLSAQPGFSALVAELARRLHALNGKLYINVPIDDRDYDYAFLGAHCDGLILMAYDQHNAQTGPGPVASLDWFTHCLGEILKVVPPQKILCALGNYGYDWVAGPAGRPQLHGVTVQEAWLAAQESEADIEFDQDSLNPHFSFVESGRITHRIWYLDAVTALNQMRSSHEQGLRGFALWRLGSEDRSLWQIWDNPEDPQSPERLRETPPGEDVDMEGRGEILDIVKRPAPGERKVTLDPDSGLIENESFVSYPVPYQIELHGAAQKKIALTFDDGPDPAFTPRILDVLKAEDVKATFFLIGLQTDKYTALARRIVAEGHQIGNHTFTHPDIEGMSRRYMQLELNLTERLFSSVLGVKTVFFRPPYDIDAEPDIADQVKPLEVVQDLGYMTVGSSIDPNDWRAGRTTDQIVESLTSQIGRGNIVLLHDGGGDREATVRALPLIIRRLRERGYELVTVGELIGKSSEEVMPRVPRRERWLARVNWLTFRGFGMAQEGIALVFFIGNVLISFRLLFIGLLAVYDRFRRQDPDLGRDFHPPVAVLIPCYNERKVIERTVRSILESDYKDLRAIVVDDGSTDGTFEAVEAAFPKEIAAGRVRVLRQENAGKAVALNLALAEVREPLYVGIDADTAVAPDAISYLVRHFQDGGIGAVAGNAKVGNRVNLWTNWQALEYVTSQNFERRAFNVLGAVSVVPGAIGAWRTEAVREAGLYHSGTVAEDADLTMSLLREGYRVVYEDQAVAFTEAPIDASGLVRQRFRWSFGILQALWKHKGASSKKSRLGWVALPNIAVFQILLPLVSPFIDLMFVAGLLTYALDRHYHPDAASAASVERLLLFFAAFMLIDFLTSVLAFALERRRPGHSEDPWLLAHLWIQRFTYRQLFSYVIFKTLHRAAEGRPFVWHKIERTATVTPD